MIFNINNIFYLIKLNMYLFTVINYYNNQISNTIKQ
jgi:hypothetical protein